MSNRGHGFTVEVVGKRRAPNADRVSKPGDARRQGRVDAGASAGGPLIRLTFHDTGTSIEARLGVVTVARVTINPTGGFLWSCYLAMVPPAPRPAADLEKAEAAIDYKVREWCQAAGLISARGGK